MKWFLAWRGRIARVRFLLLFGLLLAAALWSSGVAADDWPGFRGLGNLGRAQVNEAPIVWSDAENVEWTTAIAGQGHSSPVVVDGRIYLTSAYYANQKQLFEGLVDWLELGLLALLVIAAAAVVLRSSSVRRSGVGRAGYVGSLVLFGLCLAAVVFLVLFGANVLDWARCPIRGWISSCVFASVCAFLAGYRLTPGSIRQLLLGVGLLLFGGFVVVGIPCKEHAFAAGAGIILNGRRAAVFGTAAIPALLGLLHIVDALLQRRRAVRRGTDAVGVGKRAWIVQAALVGIAALVAVLFGVKLITCEFRPENGPVWHAVLAWTVGVAVFSACFLSWMFSRDWDLADAKGAAAAKAGFGQLVIAATVVLAFILAGSVCLAVVLRRSTFLAYHFGSPDWSPKLGWSSVAVFAAAVACALAIRLVMRARRSPPLRHWAGVFSAGIIVLAAVHFLRSVYLPATQVMTRAVVCLDERTGEVLWTCEGLRGSEGRLHRFNSAATPTPVVADGRVYAYFGSAGVMGCDVDGNPVWEDRTVTFQSVYGAGASPVVADDVLVIVNGMPKDPYLCALDCSTGKRLWRSEMRMRGPRKSGNSRTPVIQDIDGKKTVLVWGFTGLSGYELHSGEELWFHPIDGVRGDMVASIVVDQEHIYCLGPAEATALKISDLGSSKDPVAWKARFPGVNCASPVMCRGKLFAVSDHGAASCLDARSGRQLWRRRLQGEYYASLVAAAGVVYFCNHEGKTTVVEAGDQFRLLAENDVGEGTFASIVPREDALLLRTEGRLLRVAAGGPSTQLASGRMEAGRR